ncbi:MAG: cbb3-type cytochrome oxidase assembly protein CcoS [Hydrogenovibrio sp.]|uniref:cbb3-type cytochrome oxidase assembly protein CcoS n=1 Tax=Hydrogenovibrio sp. TaxID=2065821 RepID=UPI0028703705|nr:cbb3-type cytochrome oxidase assembly protein CcoS [Hydrogenovibrio sp.]MDR9498926.1 cbb3-type cytochrome oxidase assembly protein CcoS [Hydrogenovibrio sp.]
MDVVYGLIPMMLFFGFLVVLVFIWMAKKGHFDDLDGAAHSIFMDDDDDEPGASRQATEHKPDSDKAQSTERDEHTEEAVNPSVDQTDQKKS